MTKRLIQLSLGLTASVVLIVLLLRMVDMSGVAGALSLIDTRFVLPAVAVHVLAMWVRSVLWRCLLMQPRTPPLFRASIVGFAINYLMPLRVGELVRAYLVTRWCGIQYGPVFASLAVERVLDGVAMSVLLLLALPFISAPGYVVAFAFLVAGLFGALAAILMVASWRASVVLRLTSTVAHLLPRSVASAIEHLARGFVCNLEQLRNWRALPGLLALALVGWICQFAVFYFVMLAFPIAASIPMALVGGSIANFATLLPSGPGSVGAFDASLIKLLMDVQGVSIEYATAYALVVHTVVVVPILILGLIVLWRTNLSLRRIVRYTTRSQPAARPAKSAEAAINSSVATI